MIMAASTPWRTTIAGHLLFSALLLFSLPLTGCRGQGMNDAPYILITSDIHIASDAGRMQQGNVEFSAFLTKIEKTERKPELIFVVGDIVDNARAVGRAVAPGSFANWRQDIERYLQLRNRLPGVRFVQALGTGHDYGAHNVSRDVAVKWLGPERGSIGWRGIRFIWFDIRRGAFGAEGEQHQDVLDSEELSWLDTMIRSAPTKVILLCHVPVRTPETLKAGAWFNGTNLTVPTSDSLYQVIAAHQEKILAIFNGHIHQALATRLGTIPIYLCPLLPDGSYCKVTMATNGTVAVERCSVTKK